MVTKTKNNWGCISWSSHRRETLFWSCTIKLRKEVKNKVNLKTGSNHKKSTPGKTKKHEEQIAGLIGILNDPFHGVAQNMTACGKIPGNIINGLLPARKYGTERIE